MKMTIEEENGTIVYEGEASVDFLKGCIRLIGNRIIAMQEEEGKVVAFPGKKS